MCFGKFTSKDLEKTTLSLKTNRDVWKNHFEAISASMKSVFEVIYWTIWSNWDAVSEDSTSFYALPFLILLINYFLYLKEQASPSSNPNCLGVMVDRNSSLLDIFAVNFYYYLLVIQ